MNYVGTLPVFAALSRSGIKLALVPLREYYRNVADYNLMLSRLTPHGANQDLLGRLYQSDVPEEDLAGLGNHPNQALIPDGVVPFGPPRVLEDPTGPVTIQHEVKLSPDGAVSEVVVHSSLSSYLWTRIQYPDVVPEVDLRYLALANQDVWKTPLSVTLHWKLRGDNAIRVIKDMATVVQPHHDVKSVGRRLVGAVAEALSPTRRLQNGFVLDGVSRRWICLGS